MHAGPESLDPLQLLPSRRVLLLLLMPHLAACSLVLFTPWALAVKGVVSLTVLMHCLYQYLLRYRMVLPGAIVALSPVTLRSGKKCKGHLQSDSLALPGIVVLNLALGRRYRSVILCRDSAPAESLRALRVRVRLGQPK
jgi:hypothetical protein